MKIEVDELCNTGAALSRASSASLGLSFSFTGFTMPPETSDSKPFSDDDFIRKPYLPYPPPPSFFSLSLFILLSLISKNK